MSREKSCFGILFSLSIIVGIALGYIIRKGMLFEPIDTGSLSSSVTIPQEQSNQETSLEDTILVIGVDSMETDPHLEGAWLVTLCDKPDHPTGTIHLILITLYPMLAENVTTLEQSQFANPHDAIPVDVHNPSEIEHLEPLKFTEKTWSQVIILDEVAVNTAIQLSNRNHTVPINTPTADLFIKPWNNPKKAFHQQWGIITTLCEESKTFGKLNNINQIIKLYGSHLQATVNDNGLLQLWQLVNYKPTDSVQCDLYPQLTQ